MMKMKKNTHLTLRLTTEITICPFEGSNSFKYISPQQSKEMMNHSSPLIILDVRESDEYAKGHIANAILFPLSTIRPATTAERLPDKDATILVYCQSGRRSKKACILLTKLGYTHIYDFGGIMDWPYDIEA